MDLQQTKIATPTMLEGDIVLLRSTDKKGKRIEVAQRIARMDLASPVFSHVMLSLGNGLIIHAASEGVTVTTIFKLDEECNRTWQVFRHEKLVRRFEAQWPDNAVLFGQVAQFYLGQSYDFSLRVKIDRYDVAFCSELVGRVYKAFGLPFRKSASTLWPIDIGAETVSPPWHDVTTQWRAVLDDPKLRELRQQFLNFSSNRRDIIMNTRRSVKEHRHMERALADFAKKWGIPKLELPLKYWDDDA